MPGPRTQPGAGQPRRAVILTALPVEYEAVRAHLTELHEQTHKGTVYEIGKFSAPSARWEILIAEVGPGNPAAAVEAERAIDYFNPQIALFVGVAGGLKDVKLGDVVAATKVYGYESGKAGVTFQPRPDIGQSSHRMVQRAKAEAKKTWQKRIIGTEAPLPPKAFVAPMAAGQKVVADIRAATYEFLRANFTDALAVEMEGIGFLTATHASHLVEALIIRGISDLIKGKSVSDKQGWQEVASRQAAAFAFEVLAKLDLEDRGQVEPEPPARIWNVTHPRNPHFTDRGSLTGEAGKTLLDDLRRVLVSGRPAALTQAALHGLGGVGKTQLALEYAYRHHHDRRDYDLVWWVRSEDLATLAADYAALTVPLELPQKEAADQEAQVAAVRQCLEERDKWLLIFDNAGNPQDFDDYLPQAGGGHVLITSRDVRWQHAAESLPVKEMRPPEAVAFLLKRTKRDDASGAEGLAEALGYLPLALEQAAAYMVETGLGFQEYRVIFQKRAQDLLKRGDEYLKQLQYPYTVATTWELSFQKVKEASPAAADLLNLCAFLAPDDIPRELLGKGAGYLPKSLAAAVQDPVAMNDALAVLRRYSLMEVADEALAVHRLVQAVGRDRLDEEGKKQWAGAAVEMVNAAFPRDIQTDVDAWPWCGRLLPHALTATGHAHELGLTMKAAGRLLNQVGLYLVVRAEFAEARKAHERALSIDEVAYGPDHPEVAIDVNNLGSVLQVLGDLAGAKTHFERALAIGEATLGPDHPKVGLRLNNLGSVLQALGDLEGAKTHYERTLRIDEAAYGPDHPEVATDVNNLGSVLQDLGDLNGAKANYERALSIDEATYGPNHPQVATDVNNLGSVLQDLGDLERAKTHFERALAIDEGAFGPNHPQVAIRVNNLGGVLRALGDLAGARTHYKRALAIFRQFLGEDQPDTKIVRDNLASLGLPMDE